MISAQSRQRRLNGSRTFYALVIATLLVCVGCNPSRQAQKRQTPSSQSKETDDRTRVYNPATGRYEPVDDPGKLVDTVDFREDKETSPIGSTVEKKTGKKSVYDVAFLIPFETQENPYFHSNTDAKVRRFLHYYAGVKMALDDLEDRGVKISAKVHDTQDSPETAKQLIQGLGNVDVVIGPYEPESLRDAALYSTRKQTPVFSPWTPSISLDNDNPYFVQLMPGLEVHARAMTAYIDEHLGSAKVYMVARNDPKEKNRLQLFTDAHAQNKKSTIYEELIIQDASANLSQTGLGKLIDADGSTVFILPFYSRNDEDFVNAFLRKIHADKGTGKVYIFGMPQWLTFGKLNPDYLESANVHLSTAHFMDPNDPDVRRFQQRFLEIYGTVPEPAAHQAYTFFLFLGDALAKHGTGFLDVVSDRLGVTQSGDIDLVPVYRNPASERQNIPNYLENHAIHILRFSDQAYRKVQ